MALAVEYDKRHANRLARTTMKGSTPVARLRFALRGIADAWRVELTFRVQVLAGLAAVGVTALLQAGPVWSALIAVMVGAVLAAELFNTALEHALDGLHADKAEFVRIAKDCAAAAVLVLSASSIVVFLSMLADVLPRR
jgi:diacylglycerol kinase (ATP)